ncbi:MAG: hypothetical protein HS111_03145 [Kofleriaceae bacterium]|nr:hypothetical protein [Kofleriaceae bacterium]
MLSVYVQDAADRARWRSATVSHSFAIDATAPTVTLGRNLRLFNQRRQTFAFGAAAQPSTSARINTTASAGVHGVHLGDRPPAGGGPGRRRVRAVGVRAAAAAGN